MTTTTYISTNARPCAACGQQRCLPSCPDNSIPLMITTVDGLTMTGVIRAVEKGPESHAEGRNRPTWAPMWALVLVFVGGVLAALGLLFQDPVARMIWEAIHQ